MLRERYVMVRTAARRFFILVFCILILLASGPARAGRPLPHTPLQIPPPTKNEAPPEATHPYPGAPVVKSVKPDFGPRHGSALVELTGSGFEKGLKVIIGGKEAGNVEFVSNSRIRARTPENTFIGSADVIVRNPDGKAGGLLNGYLYDGSIFEVPGYNVPPDWNWTTWVRFADMNKDGKKDFLLATPWSPVEEGEYGNLRIYLQGPDRDGDGVPNFDRVRRSQALMNTKDHYTTLEAADLDKDGDLDFVATGRAEWYQVTQRNQINRIFLNDGNCNFTVKDLPGNAISKGVEIADVNGDGNPDIVIANMGAQSQLFFGDGKGNFKNVTPTHMPKAVMHTAHIHLVDVDRDGDLDAVLANTSPPKQKGGAPNRLYINDGNGLFSDKTGDNQFPAGDQQTQRVDSADIDKDGDEDLVFANRGACHWLINNGKGRFQVRPMPPFQLENRHSGAVSDVSKNRNVYVQFSDIDVDGYPDLAFCSSFPSLLIYMNVPDGGGGRTFKARPDLIDPWPSGHGAEMVELADVNGDGKPDLTITSGNEQTPLWINAWPKGFRFATCNTKLNLPYTDWVTQSCSIGDMNGDGKPDIAMGKRHDNELLLFLQGREGWTRRDFKDPSVLAADSVVENIAHADVDGDRDQDLLIGLRGKPSVLLLNDGGANYRNATGKNALPQTPMATSEILPVDVDRDGDMDLVMCNWTRGLFAAGSQKNSLFINNGKGLFEDKSKEYLPQIKSTARGGDVGDVNGDGYPDIVFACMTTTPIGSPMENQLYLNKGKQAPGRFVDASHLLPPNKSRSTDAVLSDFDGDGLLDILFSNEVSLQGKDGVDYLYRQGKDGKFEDWSKNLPAINRLVWEVRALDFNLDSAQDIFFLRSYGNYNAGYSPKGEYGRLLLNVNDGKGRFSLPTVRQFDYIDKELDWWYGSCVDDLNGDKYPEIVQCDDGMARINQTFLRTKAVAHPVYAEVPVGQAIQFDASSTHFAWGLEAKAYTWQFGDGKTGTGQKVSHAFARRGTYTVKLSVTDSASLKDEDQVTVIVK